MARSRQRNSNRAGPNKHDEFFQFWTVQVSSVLYVGEVMFKKYHNVRNVFECMWVTFFATRTYSTMKNTFTKYTFGKVSYPCIHVCISICHACPSLMHKHRSSDVAPVVQAPAASPSGMDLEYYTLFAVLDTSFLLVHLDYLQELCSARILDGALSLTLVVPDVVLQELDGAVLTHYCSARMRLCVGDVTIVRRT